jgi:hypothetical protein
MDLGEVDNEMNGIDSASCQHGINEVKSSHFAAREFLLRFSVDYLIQIIFRYELMIQFLALALLFCLLYTYKRIWYILCWIPTYSFNVLVFGWCHISLDTLQIHQNFEVIFKQEMLALVGHTV